jgi:hypothetical protein
MQITLRSTCFDQQPQLKPYHTAQTRLGMLTCSTCMHMQHNALEQPRAAPNSTTQHRPPPPPALMSRHTPGPQVVDSLAIWVLWAAVMVVPLRSKDCGYMMALQRGAATAQGGRGQGDVELEQQGQRRERCTMAGTAVHGFLHVVPWAARLATRRWLHSAIP